MEKQYKQQVAEGGASDELKFSYAVYLIKSGFKNDIRKGIRLMESKLPISRFIMEILYSIIAVILIFLTCTVL